jgi:hypothetical protein
MKEIVPPHLSYFRVTQRRKLVHIDEALNI